MVDLTSTPSVYRKIIQTIHEGWFGGEPFAIHEVRDKSGVSKSSVIRVLKLLVKIKVVAHRPGGYAGRHYRVTQTWPMTLRDAVEAFEMAKVLKV
mgnify:CR=1 FL=1